jgi:protein subunit release factor A
VSLIGHWNSERGTIKLAWTAGGEPVYGDKLNIEAGDHTVEYVPAERLRGAVATAAAIAAELRALGQEWREEWPDGRVCKSTLNEIADRLDALGGQ